MNDPIEPHKLNIVGDSLPEIERHPIVLVLDNVRSAHNVGALFRTADGAAVEAIYLIGRCPHPPHPQLQKTALGASHYVPWYHRDTLSPVLDQMQQRGYKIVALDNSPGSEELWDFKWPDKTVLVAGNEVEGLSPDTLARCSSRIVLPMYGYKRSLNVTTTLGIALYDYLRTFRREQG